MHVVPAHENEVTGSIQCVWGNVSPVEHIRTMCSINEESVNWKRNLFLQPTVKAGKAYIDECTRVIQEWISGCLL